MALLDVLKRPFERVGRNLENYMGGLLGEDVQSLPPEERRRLRQRAISALAEGMATMTPVSMTLREAAGEEVARRQGRSEREASQQRLQAAQSASSQIAGLLLGGMPAPTAPGAAAGDELTGVNVQSQYRRDPMEALRIAMSPAGADAMRINPLLQAPLQQMLAPAEAPKPTDDMREYQIAVAQGYGGSFMDYIRDVKTAGATKVSVDLGSKASEAVIKPFIDQLDKSFSAANNAENILTQTAVMQEASKRGTFTGALAEGAIGAVDFLRSFGVNVQPEVVSDTRAFQAAGNQLLLSFMAANGGARGFTESEVKILQDAFPKIRDSNQARMTIIRMLNNKAKQDIVMYNNLVDTFQKTYPNMVSPYAKKVIFDEQRFNRWLQSPEGKESMRRMINPQAPGGR